MASARTVRVDDPDVPGRPPLRPETALFLGGVVLLLLFLAFEPFLSFAVFGSDTGEYYRLTEALLTTGTLPHGAAYAGWGSAYPDFPGIYLLAGAGGGALGLDAFSALTVVIPAVAVLSVLPLFLLFRRIYPNDTVAVLAAAIASVVMPRMFTIAHPAPVALGDFLCVAALWMFVESRHDLRWFLPLSLTGGALIVTHHLSSYFFAASALGGLLFLELWRPGLWSRRFPTRELAFVAAFVSATFVFWFYGTVSFVGKVLLTGLGQSAYVGFAAFEAAGLVAVAATGALVAYRRRRFVAGRPWVRLPTDRSVIRDMVWLGFGAFGAFAIVLAVPLPGTNQTITTPLTLLWFAPVIGLGVFCAGSRRAPSVARLGPFALTWAGALALSAGGLLALSAASPLAPGLPLASLSDTLSPSRHVEYLVIPVGLLAAIGAARLVARAGDRFGRRAFLAAAVGIVVVVAANAAIVYPPASDFGGFQEGLTTGDATLWLWVGLAAPPTWAVASDHRLSSMVFGFDGNPATWVTTPALFNGRASDWPTVVAELERAETPNLDHQHPIDLVAVDSVMYHGVALSPSDLASPLSPAALAWFSGLPFVLLYENGQEAVYLVDASFLPGG